VTEYACGAARPVIIVVRGALRAEVIVLEPYPSDLIEQPAIDLILLGVEIGNNFLLESLEAGIRLGRARSFHIRVSDYELSAEGDCLSLPW